MKMLKRILAWIALIFFLFIVVNILFIHVYVTESATVFLLYVLFFFFGSKRNLFQKSSGSNITPEPSGDQTGEPEVEEGESMNEISESIAETDEPVNEETDFSGSAADE